MCIIHLYMNDDYRTVRSFPPAKSLPFDLVLGQHQIEAPGRGEGVDPGEIPSWCVSQLIMIYIVFQFEYGL